MEFSTSGDELFPTTESLNKLDDFARDNGTDGNYTDDDFDIIQDEAVQALFCILYSTIFVLGVFGNVLVCYVVGRNRAMQTVTNFFITNLALSDILLCALAVPFTPLYSFLGRWIFGSALCHLVAYAQGTSVYISTFTLTSIAIDRFFVIIYPFHPRMKLSTCVIIICSIWVFSLLVTLPYGIYMKHRMLEGRYLCEEIWPSEKFRQVFGGLTTTTQFVLPFFIIAFCYIKVSLKLNDRARSKPGAKNSRKEEADRERKRRTNRMLIAMVTIFGVSWMPLNLINILNDLYIPFGRWKYYYLCFFMAHAVAMSSTCYNPFLYAWLNENFRKEFKQVLPCFDPSGARSSSSSGVSGRSAGWRSERTCNGNETMQETLLPTSGVHRHVMEILPSTTAPGDAPNAKLRSASKDESIDVETVVIPAATYNAEGDAVLLHLTPGARILGSEDTKDSTLLAGVLGDSL
ncbi:prolactin-releasing peptide receptor [Anabrus simplex]|uniref:prolactin-releasing peptide receptor n=1 Tax=Anabrus simplex TaxID=316456 RepID=UPI0034DCCE61